MTGISLFYLIHMDITVLKVYLVSSLFSNPLSVPVIGSLCTDRGSSCVGIMGPGCYWVKQAKYSEN